jgi:hypothetical protein
MNLNFTVIFALIVQIVMAESAQSDCQIYGCNTCEEASSENGIVIL